MCIAYSGCDIKGKLKRLMGTTLSMALNHNGELYFFVIKRNCKAVKKEACSFGFALYKNQSPDNAKVLGRDENWGTENCFWSYYNWHWWHLEWTHLMLVAFLLIAEWLSGWWIAMMAMSHPPRHQMKVDYDREQLFFHCAVMDLGAPEGALIKCVATCRPKGQPQFIYCHPSYRVNNQEATVCL